MRILNILSRIFKRNLPDSLKQEVIQSLQEYRAAGIPVIVLPVIKKPIDMVVNVTLNEGFDRDKYQTIIQDSLTSFLNYYIVSKNLIRAEVIRYIMSIDESAILNVDISLDHDVPVDKYELIRAGTITVYVV